MRQIWLRHKNGGGKKYGNDCEVCPKSFMDHSSSAGDNVEVYDSRVIKSFLSDNAHVSNAHVERSIISGDARVVGYYAPWPDCLVIIDSNLSGNTRVRELACVSQVDLANVVVYGRAELLGPWCLSESVRIHQGRWEAPPRYAVIEGNGLRVVVSECVNDCFHLGCWTQTYERWTRPGYRQLLGKHAGWSKEMIEAAYDYFTTWRREPR